MITAMTTFYFLMSLLASAAPQARTPEIPRLDPSIVSVSDAFLKAVIARDAVAVAATYREDAVEMPFCRPAIVGRPAIEQYYREFFKSPLKITAFTFSPWEATVSGDVAYEAGTYKQTFSGALSGSVEDTGKYTVILKRTGGVWKAAYAIYNRDVAQPFPGDGVASR